MNYRMPFNLYLSILVVLLLCRGVGAAVAGMSGNDSGNAALTAGTVHLVISADSTSATTSPRSAPILISAAVDRGGIPVPDGTVVDFTVSSGTGTLRDATTTINGTATVMLSSTSVGQVTVSAASGAVSAAMNVSYLAQPRQAIVKLATVASPPSATLIGGLLASLSYPSEGCRISSGDVSPSGVAGSATTTLAASVGTDGQVILALLDANGIGTGEFATLTFQVADGFLPDMDDFSISPNPSVTTVAGNASIAGIDVVIRSLTLR
jgi:hypothetical protein